MKFKSLSFVASFVLFLFCVQVPTARAEQVNLTYQIYAGGVHVVESDFALDLGAKNFSTKMTAYTRGFLGSMVPWSGAFATKGVVQGNEYSPRNHVSISTWKGTDDKAVYEYGPNGVFKSLKMTEGDKDKTPERIDPELTKDTVDILSATLNMMQASGKNKKCDSENDIFDSRRRFTLRFKSQGDEVLKPSRYNLFAGDTMKCTVEVVPGPGAWRKKPRGWLSIQEQGRKKGALPTMWIAQIDKTIPPVPVRIMIKTDYGTLFAHLTHAQVGKTTYQAP